MRWPILCLIIAGFLLLQGSEPAFAQPKPVQAQDGSIAIGGSVNNSTIKQGLDEKEVGEQLGKHVQPLTEQLAAMAAQIARERGVEAAPLRAILTRLGEVRSEER